MVSNSDFVPTSLEEKDFGELLEDLLLPFMGQTNSQDNKFSCRYVISTTSQATQTENEQNSLVSSSDINSNTIKSVEMFFKRTVSRLQEQLSTAQEKNSQLSRTIEDLSSQVDAKQKEVESLKRKLEIREEVSISSSSPKNTATEKNSTAVQVESQTQIPSIPPTPPTQHFYDNVKSKCGGCHFCKCGRKFLTMRRLLDHVQRFTSRSKYTTECGICKASFGKRIHLRKHLIQVHIHLYDDASGKCLQCGHTSATVFQFFQHLEVAHSNKKGDVISNQLTV